MKEIEKKSCFNIYDGQSELCIILKYILFYY